MALKHKVISWVTREHAHFPNLQCTHLKLPVKTNMCYYLWYHGILHKGYTINILPNLSWISKSNDKLWKFLICTHEGLQARGNQENSKYLDSPDIQLHKTDLFCARHKPLLHLPICNSLLPNKITVSEFTVLYFETCTSISHL